MIKVRQRGDFAKLTRYLKKAKTGAKVSVLEKYGKEGVAALASATPVDTGKTASSWSYEITRAKGTATITKVRLAVAR